MEVSGTLGVQQVTDDEALMVQREFTGFLKAFTIDDKKPYMEELDEMKMRNETTMYINFNHLLSFSSDLAFIIATSYHRFEKFICESVRLEYIEKYPSEEKDDKGMLREFHVAFHSLPDDGFNNTIRSLRTESIGQLTSIKGTVVRTSAVHTELMSGTFQCAECDLISRNIEQDFQYTEPRKCTASDCQNTNKFKLLVEQSRFADFQKVRVQESSDEIPSGSMPRSLDIILRHEMVERAKAGDKVVFTGYLIVIPDVAQLSGSGGRPTLMRGSRAEGYSESGISGLKALGVRDLNYKLAFLATTVNALDRRVGVINVRDDDSSVEALVASLTEEERDRILAMKEDPSIYRKLTNSIAPTIFGHDEVKRGVLLMLFGGVHKTTREGINLRGDINVCIVGDPSTAKSQFLKYVSEFVPRSVYTSGKASSAAGLTAAVVKDEDSNEFYIEAGALMLADNGICCIDEFDKMDLKDQVAIHEAMEQQTISITKAGIQATLNARTSILAAANPINGRYDKSKPLKNNVALTSPIMSRFDLFFVIVDECNEATDYNIAMHITNLHQNIDRAVETDYTTEELQHYIRFARTIHPVITPEAHRMIVKEYQRLRQNDSSGLHQTSSRITVRQLESLIRLSEALARVHCDDLVRPKYVAEACRLLRKSIINVEAEDVTFADASLQHPEGDDAVGTQDTSADTTAENDAGSDSRKKDVKSITYERYMQISRQIIYHMKSLTETNDDFQGIKVGELIQWYLDQQEDFESEEQLVDEAETVRAIIRRQVLTDNVLIDVTPGSQEERNRLDEGDHVVMLHINYSENEW